MNTYKIGNKAYALKADANNELISSPITYKVGWESYTTVGSPTIASDNVVDNFTTSNYIKTKKLDLGANWEFRTRFKVNNLSSLQRVFDGITNQYLLVMITTSGALQYGVGDGTSYYNLVNGTNAILRTGYWFEVKMTYDGSVYKAYISSDNGITWLEDWSYESDMIIPPFVGVFGISRDLKSCINKGRIALGSQNTWFKITKTSTLELSDLISIVGEPNISLAGVLGGINDSNYVELPHTVSSYFNQGAEWQLTFRTPEVFRERNTYVFGAPWFTSIWIQNFTDEGVLRLVAQDWGQTTNNITILLNEIKPNTNYTIKFKKVANQIIEYYYNDELLGTTKSGNTGATNMSYCRLGKIGSANTYMTGTYDLTKCYVIPAGSTEPIYLAKMNIVNPQYYVWEGEQ